MKSASTRPWLTCLIVRLGCPAAIAQTVPAIPATAQASSEAVLLTPCEVSSEPDHGHAAIKTLAGTRMRTNLPDAGASLTTLPPESLRDLGVTSLNQARLPTRDDGTGGPGVSPRSAGRPR